MVLWGQSAGANAVDSYAYAYSDEDAIVSGLIADSGAASQVNQVNYSSFSKLGSFFGCGGLSSKEELACMQKVDPHDIQNLLQGAASSGNTSVPSFGPVADGLTVHENNTERMESGLVAHLVRNTYHLNMYCYISCDRCKIANYGSRSSLGITSTKVQRLRLSL